MVSVALLLFYLQLHFPPGVISVSAGAAPAEGGISASAARQAACTEKRPAETQADNHTRGDTYTRGDTHQHPGNYTSHHKRSGSLWPVEEHGLIWKKNFILLA